MMDAEILRHLRREMVKGEVSGEKLVEESGEKADETFKKVQSMLSTLSSKMLGVRKEELDKFKSMAQSQLSSGLLSEEIYAEIERSVESELDFIEKRLEELRDFEQEHPNFSEKIEGALSTLDSAL